MSRLLRALIAQWCRVVQNAPMSTKVSTPTPNVRLTITVSPAVHEAFERLSKASGVSMSKSMGEWLADTLDAVEYTAGLMERARASPKIVAREIHAYAQGLADETGGLLNKVLLEGRRAEAERRSRDPQTASPPSSNTGGKTPPTTQKKQARK